MRHRNARRIKKVKKEKITAACKRSTTCIFFFFQNESCFRSNKPYSSTCFFSSSSFIEVIPTLPCVLPYVSVPERWVSRALAPDKLCLPTSWPGPAQSLSCQSFLTGVSLLSAGKSNEPCRKYLTLRSVFLI